MRQMTALVIVLVFIAVSSVGLAFFMIQVNRAGLLLSGKVSEIKECPQRSLVTLSLPDGKSYRFSSTNDRLDGIEIGDRITVREVKGQAASVEKTDMTIGKTGNG
jgi:hypothetical protein